jgi:phage repressor protein C with HTH and peptisase S24 domain
MNKQVIREFEEDLKAGKNPSVKEYRERYGGLDERTITRMRVLQALYDLKKEMKLPEGFEKEQEQLARDLVAGKRPKKLKKWEERTKGSADPVEIPHPLTMECGGVPVVSMAAAGESKEFPVGIMLTSEGWEKITRPFDLPDKDIFAVQIKGQSLEPLIPDGAYAIVNPHKEAASGELAWILKKDYHACIKKVKFKGDKVILISGNPEYPPVEIDRSEILKIHPVVWVKFK